MSDTKTVTKGSVLTSLTDPQNKRKVWNTAALLWSFIVLGWTFGQYGPSILELQIITNVSLQYASGFLMGHNTGYLCGALLSGTLFDRISGDKSVSLLISAIGFAVILAIIPWCFMYEIMVAAHILKGFFGSAIDTCGNAFLAYEWASDGKTFHFLMQVLHFIFAAAGIISPFAISPFLTDQTLESPKLINFSTNALLPSTRDYSQPVDNIEYSISSINFSDFVTESTSSTRVSTSSNNASNGAISPSFYTSQIYIPFSVTSFLSLSSAMIFFILKTQHTENSVNPRPQDTTCNHKRRVTTKSGRIFLIICVMVLFGTSIAIEDGANTYLATFCVRHMIWSPARASAATSLFWASFASGRLIGIISVKRTKPRYQVLVDLFMLTSGLLCLLLSANYYNDIGIYVSIVLIGLGTSVIFPGIFTWVDQELFSITGKMTSLFITAASVGTMINPILLGYLMENVGSITLTYVLLSNSSLALVLFIFLLKMSPKFTMKTNKEKSVANTLPVQSKVSNGKCNPAFESTDL